jgi:hypothetical protein
MQAQADGSQLLLSRPADTALWLRRAIGSPILNRVSPGLVCQRKKTRMIPHDITDTLFTASASVRPAFDAARRRLPSRSRAQTRR